MSYQRRSVDVSEEKKILTGMITSTSFIREVFPMAKKDYFQSPFSQMVFSWIEEYYTKYHQAPVKHIEDIYEIKKGSIADEDKRMVASFLSDLSEQYDESFNEQFYKDRAGVYFKSQDIINRSKRAKSFAELGELDKAEDEFVGFKQVYKQISNVSKIHMPEYVDYLNDDDSDHLLKFPGGLGELFGWWDREWLVAVQAGYGTGKTTFLQEIRLLAIQERLKVAEFSLEMSAKRLARRFYKRITQMPDQEKAIFYPVFDCYWNQIGTCRKPQRIGRVALVANSEAPKPPWQHEPSGYQVCTACRSDRKNRDDYGTATWYQKIVRESIGTTEIKATLKAMLDSFGDNHRLICYPRFTANLEDIQRDLDMLEYTEGFVPDVVIVDYADILRPEDDRIVNEEQLLNRTWMALSKMANERHCLVVTASQIKTEALVKKKRGKMGDASGSARAKYAHTQFVFALAQTDEEKNNGIMRVNVIKNSDGEQNESKEVIVLQALDIGCGLLDSESA